jgi:ABC-type dipeptide/oligopeptide/nickel transport system permease component
MLLKFVVQKFLRVITVLIGVALITFLLMHAIPGTPWSNYSDAPRIMSNMGMDETSQRELERRFGLDQPLWRQFTRYLFGDFDAGGSFFCGAVCGNLGPSIQMRGRTVQDILFAVPEDTPLWESRFGYSLRLVLLGACLAAGIGIPLGIVSSIRPNSVLSRAISVGLAASISIPNFVLGLLAIIVLASGLRVIQVLPDWHTPNNWIMPAVVLAMMPMAGIARVTRAAVMNILSEEYIRTARAKGLTETRVLLVHALRIALVPIIIFMGPALMEMFTGVLVLENMLGFPGFGRQYWESIIKLDYPMILGLTLVYAVGIVLVNGVVEILAEMLDPRIRSARQPEAP